MSCVGQGARFHSFGDLNMLLPLTGGDPALGPATFTRMVLPFAYHLRMLRRQRRETDRICWTACEPEQHEPVTMAERLRYFTPETAEVLHGGRMIRARLPEISEDARGKLDLGDEPLDWWRGGKRCPMRVRMGAPHILLFETKAGNIQSPSALQMGLLVLEFSFHREVDWDAILAFNEAFGLGRHDHLRYPQRVERVGASALRALARQLLDLRHRVVAVVGP